MQTDYMVVGLKVIIIKGVEGIFIPQIEILILSGTETKRIFPLVFNFIEI